MSMQESIVSELLTHRFGASVRELSKTLRQDSSIVHEHLLVMLAMGDVSQRQVGRDQVFMLVKKANGAKETDPAQVVAPLPSAPAREPAVNAEPAAAAQAELEPVPEPVPEPAPAAKVAAPAAEAPAAAVAPTSEPVVDAAPVALAPTLYDRIGGVLVLEIGDDKIATRFSSVEQLQRFINDLIAGERAAA